MNEMILLADNRVKQIPVIDNEEPLVDLRTSFPELHFDLDRRNVQKESRSISLARRRVGEMLVQAQAFLPPYLRLLIKECHRPLWVQESFFVGYSDILQRENPHWNPDTLSREASRYCAPPEVAPHTTGGAIDLTLMTTSGNELEMGTEFNASPEATRNATYTNATAISREARFNRSILIDVMTQAGFVNYPTEWWHWSYGDQYWALATGGKNAIYGHDFTQEDFRWTVA